MPLMVKFLMMLGCQREGRCFWRTYTPLMRKIVLGLAVAAAATLTPAIAGAAAPPNDHNCVGAADGSLAGPGFGGLVSGIAKSSPGAIAASLDPFANCGNRGPRP
jgi:hypothetical protein